MAETLALTRCTRPTDCSGGVLFRPEATEDAPTTHNNKDKHTSDKPRHRAELAALALALAKLTGVHGVTETCVKLHLPVAGASMGTVNIAVESLANTMIVAATTKAQ